MKNQPYAKRPNRIMLVLGICLVAFAISFTFITTAKAETVSAPEATADFDLSKQVNQQKFLRLNDGSSAVMGVRYIPDSITPVWDSYYQNASGNWEIYYYSPIVSRSFFIDISNHKIVNAYDPKYSTLFCTVTSEQFTWNSRSAVYRIGIQSYDSYSSVLYLKATMEGTTLHTYAD